MSCFNTVCALNELHSFGAVIFNKEDIVISIMLKVWHISFPVKDDL